MRRLWDRIVRAARGYRAERSLVIVLEALTSQPGEMIGLNRELGDALSYAKVPGRQWHARIDELMVAGYDRNQSMLWVISEIRYRRNFCDFVHDFAVYDSGDRRPVLCAHPRGHNGSHQPALWAMTTRDAQWYRPNEPDRAAREAGIDDEVDRPKPLAPRPEWFDGMPKGEG